MRNIDKIVKLSKHPLEDVLGIESNSTEVVKYERNTELIEYEEYDEKEKEIENNYQEIADLAISSFKKLEDMTEQVDPKFLARLIEVQNQTLGTALAAIEKRSRLKETRDKANARQKTLQAKNNNGVSVIAVMDRNSMLELVKNAEKDLDNVIDVQDYVKVDKNE